MTKLHETASTFATDAIDKSQQMFTRSLSAYETMIDSAVTYNTAIFKSSEVIAKKAYDTYVSNSTDAFDTAKSLAKTTDIADFTKVASSHMAKSAEKYIAQSKDFLDMSTKLTKDNAELTKTFYAKSFAA